jgi:hypothetical protein
MTDIPTIRFFEWDVDEIASPIGNRNIPGGSFAFKQMLASGCQHSNPLQPATTSGTLIFTGTKIDYTGDSPPSHHVSSVTAITINLGSSGVAISDMRLFLRDDSGLRASVNEGLDPAFIQMAVSGSWHPFSTLPSGAATRLTTSVPDNPNIRRQDGNLALLTEDDENSSQFAYMNIIIPLGAPLGTYGICGSGAIRFGLMFSYFPV